MWKGMDLACGVHPQLDGGKAGIWGQAEVRQSVGARPARSSLSSQAIRCYWE